MTDRILFARDALNRAGIGSAAVDILLSHAVPDAAGTRRVVIEQTEGGEAVLLGSEFAYWSSEGAMFTLPPLPEKDQTDGR